MDKYMEMVSHEETKITKGDQPPILETDSDEIIALKKTPLWNFDFSRVPNAPCTTMGEHAPDVETAKRAVAERLAVLAGDKL